MARVVLGVGSSHGPSIQISSEQWPKLGEGDTRDPRFNYQELLKIAKPGLDREILPEVQSKRHAAAHAALAKLRNIVAEAKLDVAIVISNVHRVRPADHHPVFGIFRAENFPVMQRKDKRFDPDARFISEDKREADKHLVDKPGKADLATHLVKELIEDQFDVGCLDELPKGTGLDDAFVFPYEYLFGGATIPMIPFLLSRDLPNQATSRRCYDVGTALRRAVESWPADLRVGFVASGGLSHQLLDEDLDTKVVKALTSGDKATLSSLPRDRLNRGPGTPEILNWVTVSAALAPTNMTLVDYVPAYRSLASTGHGLAFGYWQ
jgi:hypothetical protein